MLKLDDFFGLSIERDKSDIIYVFEKLKIDKEIEKTNVVKTLVKKNGRKAPIITVARRQQALKMIRPLINETMLDYDPIFYEKEIATSSEHDRRYDAEDHLLAFALLVASTKSPDMMADDPNIINVKQLRESAFKESRFEKCWNILSEETRHIVTSYRKSK